MLVRPDSRRCWPEHFCATRFCAAHYRINKIVVAFELRIKSALVFYGLFILAVVSGAVTYDIVEKRLKTCVDAKQIETREPPPYSWLG